MSGLMLTSCQPYLGPQPLSSGVYFSAQDAVCAKEELLSVSGDDFTVKTISDKTPVCRCNGRVVSLRQEKDFLDVNGKKLFTLRTKLFSMRKSFYGKSPQGCDFAIKRPMVQLPFIACRATVSFKNASDARDIMLKVKKRSWCRKTLDVMDGQHCIAVVSQRLLDVRDIATDKQTYRIDVAAYVDISLLAAVVVAMDEWEESNSR